MSSKEELKSSAHVWGGEDPIVEPGTVEDSPPAYSGAGPETIQPPQLPLRPTRKPIPRTPYHPVQAIAKWSTIPWNRYVVPDATVSADRTTITTTHATFVSNQQALIQLITDHAALPPIPMVRISGSHVQASNHTQKIDFDITLNLSTLLDLSSPPRWHNKPAQVVPLPSPSGKTPASISVTGNNYAQIEGMARQFLKDKSDRKSFTLTKTVENLPQEDIEGYMRNLIASLNYRGKVNVTFPIQCSQLVVQKKPGNTGAAVGGWFMNVLGLSPDVKYETLERVWQIGYSTPQSQADGSSDSNLESEGSSRSHEIASALVKEWCNAWAPAIRDAVLMRRQSKVGIEDWMESQMGWRPMPMARDWGVDYA